mmetsp:Transcript_5716/g.21625  ORF Transcript_5716/g.21625 Transcript_5716/m.21625 type:complete len:524 (+) Transcript_5716:1225-2796(+)
MSSTQRLASSTPDIDIRKGDTEIQLSNFTDGTHIVEIIKAYGASPKAREFQPLLDNDISNVLILKKQEPARLIELGVPRSFIRWCQESGIAFHSEGYQEAPSQVELVTKRTIKEKSHKNKGKYFSPAYWTDKFRNKEIRVHANDDEGFNVNLGDKEFRLATHNQGGQHVYRSFDTEHSLHPGHEFDEAGEPVVMSYHGLPESIQTIVRESSTTAVREVLEAPPPQPLPQVKIVEKLVEVPKIEYVDRPVIQKEIQYVDRPVIQKEPEIVEVIKEVIVEKPVIEYVDREVIVEKPVVEYREIEKPVYIEKEPQIIEVIKEVIVEKPVLEIREIEKPIIVERPTVEIHEVEIERPVIVEKIVPEIHEIEKQVIVEKPVIQYVDRPVIQKEAGEIEIREIEKPIIVEKPVLEIREIEKPVIVERTTVEIREIEVEKPIIVEKIVPEIHEIEKQVIVEKPVLEIREIEKPVIVERNVPVGLRRETIVETEIPVAELEHKKGGTDTEYLVEDRRRSTVEDYEPEEYKS